MVEALETRCKEDDIIHAVKGVSMKKSKLKGKVLPKLYKEELEKFESSGNNMLRSIAIYYSNGVMGRVKYRSVYKAFSYSYATNKMRVLRLQTAPHLGLFLTTG